MHGTRIMVRKAVKVMAGTAEEKDIIMDSITARKVTAMKIVRQVDAIIAEMGDEAMIPPAYKLTNSNVSTVHSLNFERHFHHGLRKGMRCYSKATL
jgi:hypothetical protein